MHSCIRTLQIALLIPGIDVAHGFSKGFPAGPLQASDQGHPLLARPSMQRLSSAMVDLDPPRITRMDRQADGYIDRWTGERRGMPERTNERMNE